MSIALGDVELRVLGVLIEKSLTQPGSYPLTMNAITLGANQSQNREPVENFDESEVTDALRGLQLKHLVAQAPPEVGARVVRFVHRVVDVLKWDRRQQAVMAELTLRGPQTCGELRTRASRMTPLQDTESVRAILQELIEADPPFVEELPREPGRSANRFRHLLSAEPPGATPPSLDRESRVGPTVGARENSRTSGPPPQTVTPPQTAAPPQTVAPPEQAPKSPAKDADRSLTERVSQLEGQVAALTRVVDGLRIAKATPGDEPPRCRV